MNTKGIIKDTIILFAMTLICGLALAIVHEVTLEPIAAANLAAQQAAYAAVFPTADHFDELDGFEPAEYEQDGNIDTIDSCVVACDASGEALGYVINATDPSSYGGNLTLSLGVQLDGTVNGYSILEINDTAGLGMKAREEAFSSQYANKNVEAFVVTKTGSTSDAEIDAISGATISSRAVTRAVNSGLEYFRSLQ